MGRPSTVYILFATVFGLGIWAILSIGAITLTAPDDLAGKWTIAPLAGGALSLKTDSLLIEQSGRYVEFKFDGGPVVSVTLDKRDLDEKSLPHRLNLEWTGGDWKVTADGPQGGDDLNIHIAGPQTFDFQAHRTERTYPVEARGPAGESAEPTGPTSKPASNPK